MLDMNGRVAEFMASHEIPGVSVAVWHGGALHRAAAGVLNVDTGVEATTDAVFQVGSITKLFTGVLVMQLVDDGLVDLDAPVRSYLPGFALADPEAAAAVTVRHLLTHTGGFEGDVFTDTGRGDDCLGRYVSLLADARQLHPVGRMFSYCNSGFSVLGALVAAVRGAACWEQVMRERLISPLGLTVALFAEEALLHRASVGHHKPPGADRQEVLATWQMPRSGAPAGASLATSPGELVRFGRMLMAGGVGDNGARVLSAGSVAAMLDFTTPTTSVYGTRCGLAAMSVPYRGADTYGHSGYTIGQGAFLICVPEHDLAVAVCGNNPDLDELRDDLLDRIVTDLTGATPPPSVTPPDPPSTIDVGRYVGRYIGPSDEWIVVAAGDSIDATVVPGELGRSFGDVQETHHWVHLRDEYFVRVKPAGRRHPTIAFLDGGTILHTSRVYTKTT